MDTKESVFEESNIIASDGLLYLDIKETFFQNLNGEQAILRVLCVETDRWVVASSSVLDADGILKLVTSKDVLKFPCRTEKMSFEQFSSCYLIIFTEPLPEMLVKEILFLKKTIRTSSRRKEDRFTIGVTNYKKFGFSSPVQQFKIKDRKSQCFMNNVSVHGAMITVNKIGIQNGERLLLMFNLETPSERILQPAIVVNVKAVSLEYSQISLSFTAPVSFLWQKRVLEYQEQ